MASNDQVKNYLAYWFQLGKKIAIHRGEAIRPGSAIYSAIYSDRYSTSLKFAGNQVQSFNLGDCHLEGTGQSIAE